MEADFSTMASNVAYQADALRKAQTTLESALGERDAIRDRFWAAKEALTRALDVLALEVRDINT